MKICCCEDSLSKDIKLDIGCWVFLTPFLRAIRKFRSPRTSHKEEWLGLDFVYVMDSDSWVSIWNRFGNLLLKKMYSGTTIMLPFFSPSSSSSRVLAPVGIDLRIIEGVVSRIGVVRDEYGKSGKLKLASGLAWGNNTRTLLPNTL